MSLNLQDLVLRMNIAIIGAGPAGSVLASLMAKRGHSVVVFDENDRPELLVGESLVPGLIPVLQKLEIEERVAEIGVLKPGVTFYPGCGKEVAFRFSSLPRRYPQYAYNVPRPAFDRILQKRARELGVEWVETRAQVFVKGDHIQLSSGTLELATGFGGAQPDLVVDASGRRRLIARLFGIGAHLGPRKDVSYFAHFEGFEPEQPAGQVRINRLQNGWSWRIPLKGRMSFGIVLNQRDANALGGLSEERIENAIRRDPLLCKETRGFRRVSEVQTYGNYQLISERGVGANWAAIGDAFGFVDPMLSPGMMVAAESAAMLDEMVSQGGTLDSALQKYACQMTAKLESWMDLISYFYDGRIFDLHEMGKEMQARHTLLPFGFVERFMSTNMAGMASGFTTASPISRGVLRYMDKFVVGPRTSSPRYAIA